MNLITDGWIPITWRDSVEAVVGLDELFHRCAEIRDLSVKPHERIALLRLLVCITQAALDGPKNHREWEECVPTIPAKTGDYLQRWKSAFELFGPERRFLQVPDLARGSADGEGNSATKLDLTLATGHNATIFDNAGGGIRPQSPANLALALLAFQCLSPAGIIGAVKWKGKEITKCTGRHAPAAAASMLHCFLVGCCLLETIRLNLLDRQQVSDNYGPEGWGRPIWEFPVETELAKAEIRNATMTYLGRLVPFSRLVRLFEDGEKITIGNGLTYPVYSKFREASATLIERKNELAVLSASLEKSIWRQLPAITVKNSADRDSLSGPLALANLPGDTGATLWLGALVTDKAKIEDVVEATYHIPAGMFLDAGRQVFEKGIGFADDWEQSLGRTVKAYAECLKLQPVPHERARRFFWTAVEQQVPVLLELTDSPALAADMSASKWGRAVRAAAEQAYESSCPRQTPRQIEAFAKGRQQLFLRRSSPRPVGEANTESDNPQQNSKT
jgi:CRISPR system Cascade subunit CasA